jgi:hypothetical protein
VSLGEVRWAIATLRDLSHTSADRLDPLIVAHLTALTRVPLPIHGHYWPVTDCNDLLCLDGKQVNAFENIGWRSWDRPLCHAANWRSFRRGDAGGRLITRSLRSWNS